MVFKNIGKPLVSIIVPAYNVSKFLGICANSILNQTYSNLELLIINDGSKDNTKEVAEEIASKDARVCVINKENGGVSDTRNRGIEESKGEYLVFVDGDDYLAPEYLEYMLGMVDETGCKFCLSKNCFQSMSEHQIENDKIVKLSGEDAAGLLLSLDVVVGCWNKIFKKSLLIENDIRFSTNLFYGEGLKMITDSAQKSGGVGVGLRKVYYYRRDNVSSATTDFKIKNILNGEHSLIVIKENFGNFTPYVGAMWHLHMSTYYLLSALRIKQNNLMSEYRNEYKKWMQYVRAHTPSLVLNKYIRPYRKCLLIAGCLFPSLILKLYINRRSKQFNNSCVGKFIKDV